MSDEGIGRTNLVSHKRPIRAGIYSGEVQKRLRAEQSTQSIIPLPPRIIGGLRDCVEKVKQCNCKKSNCLKLYCECFAHAILCSDLCNCVECKNNDKDDVGNTTNTSFALKRSLNPTTSMTNAQHRDLAIHSTLANDPHSYRPKLGLIAGSSNTRSSAVHQDPDNVAFIGLHAKLDSATAIASSSSPLQKSSSRRGCNCKKSFCLKKYCECFQNRVTCNKSICNCQHCKNTEDNEEREAKLLTMIASESDHHSNHTSKNSSGEGGIFGVTPAYLFLPPSSFAIPLHIAGAEAPIISFGTCRSRNRVDIILKDQQQPVTSLSSGVINQHDNSRIYQKSPSPDVTARSALSVQQLRDPNNSVVLETDLQKKWRLKREETNSVLHDIGTAIQLVDVETTSSFSTSKNIRRRGLNEIAVYVQSKVKNMLLAASHAKTQVLEDEEMNRRKEMTAKDLNHVLSERIPSSVAATPSPGRKFVLGNDDEELLCQESLVPVRPASFFLDRERMNVKLATAQKAAIIEQLAICIRQMAHKIRSQHAATST